MVLVVPLLRAVAAASSLSLIQIHVQTPFRADVLAAGASLAWRSRQPHPESLFRFAPWAMLAGIGGVIGLMLWDGHLVWDT